MKFLEKNFPILLVVALFLFLYFQGVFTRGGEGTLPTPDTTSTSTTTQVAQPTVIVVPTPGTQTSSVQPIVLPPQYQPNENYAALVAQYEELAKKYLAVNTFKDSISLKDSAGLNVGVVNLEQEVSENSLKLIKPSYTLKFPHTTTTNTITITQPYKPRNQFYVGIEAGGPIYPALSINQASLGILFKNKKDQIVGASLGYSAGDKALIGQLKYYRKLSFK